MGYRSTVAYTIRFVSEDDKVNRHAFYTFLAEAKAKDETAGCFTDDESFEVDEAKLEFRFFADYVKWYESYPEVACHEALMYLSKEWADDDHEAIGGAFARIGEEMEDTVEEVWGHGEYDWISVSRSMNCDWMN